MSLKVSEVTGVQGVTAVPGEAGVGGDFWAVVVFPLLASLAGRPGAGAAGAGGAGAGEEGGLLVRTEHLRESANHQPSWGDGCTGELGSNVSDKWHSWVITVS